MLPIFFWIAILWARFGMGLDLGFITKPPWDPLIWTGDSKSIVLLEQSPTSFTFPLEFCEKRN